MPTVWFNAINTSRGICHLHGPDTSVIFLVHIDVENNLEREWVFFWQCKWRAWGWMCSFPLLLFGGNDLNISTYSVWIPAIPWDRWYWITPEDREDENGYLFTDSRSPINLSKVCPVLCAGLDPICDGSRILASTEWVILLSGCHFKPVEIWYTG